MIDAESIHLTDTDGADILSQVAEELDAQGTSLMLAAVHPPVLELWQRGGVIDAIGADAVFDTVPDAVRAVNGRTRVTAAPRPPGPSASTGLEADSAMRWARQTPRGRRFAPGDRSG